MNCFAFDACDLILELLAHFSRFCLGAKMFLDQLNSDSKKKEHDFSFVNSKLSYHFLS